MSCFDELSTSSILTRPPSTLITLYLPVHSDCFHITVLTCDLSGSWCQSSQEVMSHCVLHTSQQGRPPRPKPPHSTQKSEPLREKGEPLTCSPYKQSGGSSGFSPSGPAFSLQREYLSVVTGGVDRWEGAGPDFRG